MKKKDETEISLPFICRSILLILVIGVVIRLVLGFLMTHVYDIYHWGVVIQNINSGNGLYEITGYFYTPPWGYLLGLVAASQDLLGITLIGERLTETFPLEEIAWYYTSTITTPTFNLTMMIILLISDLVVGYLVFWIIRDLTKDRRKSIIGFALWFLCPFVILSGSVIGMFDTISVLMTLLAVIMVRKGRYMEAGVMLGLATLTKFFPGFFLFIFIAYILSKNRADGSAVRKTVIFLAGIAVISFIILLPQLLDGTIAEAFLFITSRLREGTTPDSIGVVSGYAALLIYVAALIVSILFAMRISRNGDENRTDSLFLDALLITTVVMFLFPPLPQYVLLLLPFVLFAMTTDIRYRIPCILLFIGTSVASLAGGPTDLVAAAAYTNLIDLDSLIGIIQGYTAPMLGSSPLLLVGYVGYAIQYVGILCVLWVRFGEKIKRKILGRRSREERTPDNEPPCCDAEQ